jgi:hypothetical protein
MPVAVDAGGSVGSSESVSVGTAVAWSTGAAVAGSVAGSWVGIVGVVEVSAGCRIKGVAVATTMAGFASFMGAQRFSCVGAAETLFTE